ncbi:MAG: glycosyltransferase [Bacteroidetes bacterium]|nr:glycosyltransferase [Bacteroidota bacterium]
MQPIEGISLIIPNYNGEQLLPQILPPAIVALSATGITYEIIVVDDASADQSVAMLTRDFPQVQIIQIQTNGGFSKTANTGIYAARYNWVLLLNSDVKLTPTYFESMLPYCQHADVFSVSGRIVGWDTDQIQDGGKYPVLQGAKIKTSYDFIPTGSESTTFSFPCFYSSGANAFINRKLFLELGGFNELFSPYYVEDTELSLRAWRLGFSNYYQHHAICAHRTSSTIGSSERKKQIDRIYNRNKYLLHAIHLDGLYLLSWLLQLKLELIFRILTFRFTPLFSYVDLIKLIPAIIKSRNRMRQLAAGKNLQTVPALFHKIQQQINQYPVEIQQR